MHLNLSEMGGIVAYRVVCVVLVYSFKHFKILAVHPSTELNTKYEVLAVLLGLLQSSKGRM